MTAHATRGASKIKRLIECPASEIASEGIPDESSAAAEEGTRAHAAAEHYLERNYWPNDTPPEMVRHLSHYVKYLTWRQLQVGEKNVAIEQRVSLAPLGFENAFGTADAIIRDFPHRLLEVADLKYGAGVYVDEVDNKQLRYYALGALLTLTPAELEQIDTVRTTICQPRNGTHEPRSDEFSVLELVSEFAGELAEAFKRLDRQRVLLSQRLPLDYKAGGHCRFCPARVKCETLRVAANLRATNAFKVAVINAEMTPERIAEELKMIDGLRGWIEALKAHASHVAQRGTKIPGMKVVESRGHGKFTDEAAVREVLTMFGHADEMTEPPKLRSPAQIRDEVVSPQVWDYLEGHVHRPVVGYRLVPESARGTALDGPLDPSVAFKE